MVGGDESSGLPLSRREDDSSSRLVVGIGDLLLRTTVLRVATRADTSMFQVRLLAHAVLDPHHSTSKEMTWETV